MRRQCRHANSRLKRNVKFENGRRSYRVLVYGIFQNQSLKLGEIL